MRKSAGGGPVPSEGPEVHDMIGGAPHLIAYESEVRNVGKEVCGHFSDAFEAYPGLAAINRDMSICGIEGSNGFRCTGVPSRRVSVCHCAHCFAIDSHHRSPRSGAIGFMGHPSRTM